MSKDQPPYDDEIDLFNILETLWAGKWKIIGTTVVMAFVGYSYTLYNPKSYQISAQVQKANQSVFLPYISLNYLINANREFLENPSAKSPSSLVLNSSSMFKMFITEFVNYEGAITALSKDEFIMEPIKGLDKISKQRALINHAKSFKLTQTSTTLEKSRGKEDNWILSTNSNNKWESLRLFDDVIQQTLINVQEKTIANIKELILSLERINLIKLEKLRNNLNLMETNQLYVIKKHLKYLSEQTAIAKDLGIESSSLDGNIYGKNQFTLNVNASDFPYYLRGTKAINKEISLIKNRSEEDLLIFAEGYLRTKREISTIEKDLTISQLRAASNLIAADNPNNWVNVNFNLAEIQLLSLGKNRLAFFFSIVLGGVMGVIYVLFANTSRKRKNKVVKT